MPELLMGSAYAALTEYVRQCSRYAFSCSARSSSTVLQRQFGASRDLERLRGTTIKLHLPRERTGSRKRGVPSNNQIRRSVRQSAMTLVRQHYADFGPTLACEKLRGLHDCRVSRETLRKWMIEDGLWLDRRRRLPSVHQPRDRRARRRSRSTARPTIGLRTGAGHTLLAFIDDATSRIQHAAFVPSESAFDYMRDTRAYVERHGRPIVFYSDKHAIFRVNKTDAEGGTGMTQFGRPLHEIARRGPERGDCLVSWGWLHPNREAKSALCHTAFQPPNTPSAPEPTDLQMLEY
jgi:hypothetical protein